MNFDYFTSVGSSGALCRKADFNRLTHLPFVKQMIDEYRAGNASAKRRLPAFDFHAHFPSGKRKNENAVPSMLYMLDFDHCSEEEINQIVDVATPRDDEKDTTNIFLIHITPSGKGIRIVAKAVKTGSFAMCRSISDFQHTLAKQLKCEHKLDEVTKDPARLSFVPWHEDVLYLNDRLFTDKPELERFEDSALASLRPMMVPDSTTPHLFPESEQSTYDGLPLDEIFREYFALTGGLPQEGARNSRFYVAARDLRYICDFNPRVIAAHLPDVGLPLSEVFQLCSSACLSTRSACHPAPPNVMRAVQVAKEKTEVDGNGGLGGPESAKGKKFRYMPTIFRDIVKACPDDFKEAVILSLLPIIGTLSTKVRARYIDGEIHSASFFTVVMSEQASGKSFARRLVRFMLSSIAEEDAVERAKEQAYKEELKIKKNAKELPQAPRVKIRIVPASISIAKLLQRMDYAEGDHLFTFCEEMDTLVKSNKSGAWSQKNDLYRNGFDNSEYGQDYLSDTSYSANLQVFYNLLVLGTPRQVDRFFSDLENGMASRCCFASIADQFGAKMPHFEKMDDAVVLRIAQYIKMLRQAEGMYDLSFLYEPLEKWLEKHRLLSLQENNRSRDIFRRRAAVIGFRAVLSIAPLYNLGQSKTRDRLIFFALDIAELVLNNQLDYAGERLNDVINDNHNENKEKMTPCNSIYQSLPEVFTSMQVANELIKRQMKSPARQLIYRWAREGMVKKNENKTYQKVY